MTKDLTSSTVSRQNILNNNYALEQIESNLSLGGIFWRDANVFTKAQVANLLAIDERTIDRYLESNKEELLKNGYRVLKGKDLKDFKAYVDDIDVVDISKAPSLGAFSFRAVLNIAMLVTESEKAKAIRSKILDIVIDVVAQKAGGVESRQYGALTSMEDGVTLAFSLANLQERGVLFVNPQTKVYKGMIVGEHSRTNDLDVNPIKGKAQLNVRSSGADEAIKLVPPRDMNLERALEWIEDDELLEVTPLSIRIRKKWLDPTDRKRYAVKK